jgi:hypothetical protein
MPIGFSRQLTNKYHLRESCRLSTVAGCGDLVLLRTKAQGRERKTILIPVQILVYAVIATYLVYAAADFHRRNHRSWQAIVSRLSPDASAATRPRRQFRNAGVMMEMADYIERNARDFDAMSLLAFRANALRMRFAALGALIRL